MRGQTQAGPAEH